VPSDVFGGYTVVVSKTFYIETFGCQMNAHDSEKVIGTLEQQGYARVEDEGEAGLILYNTCSIRDKAEQKVFHRLNEYKRLQGEGKKFAVLGCVAQQEGERIFEKAPYVSLVAGSASYRNLPEMLRRLEAGEQRITAECDLVSLSFGADVVCGAAGGGGRDAGNSAGSVYYVASAGLYAGYRGGDRCYSNAV
jgi:tRNA A37 methylthiotransferase MiaB